MNCIAQENSLNLPIGTKISVKRNSVLQFGNSFNYYNGNNTTLPKTIRLINGSDAQTFYAVFNENDVDFEIYCDNQLCPRGIRLTLIINEKKHPFYIPPAKFCTFQALETNGRKLHFLSQNTAEGQQMVAATAEKHGTSIAEASVNCSKIIFTIEVEQCLRVFVDPFGVSLLGNRICVNIQTLTGKTTYIMVGSNNTVLDLKKLFAKQEATSVNHTLIHNSVALSDSKTLTDCGICDDSKLYVIYNSGFTPPVFGTSSNASIGPLFSQMTTHTLDGNSSSNSKPLLFGPDPPTHPPTNSFSNSLSNSKPMLFGSAFPPTNNSFPMKSFGSAHPPNNNLFSMSSNTFGSATHQSPTNSNPNDAALSAPPRDQLNTNRHDYMQFSNADLTFGASSQPIMSQQCTQSRQPSEQSYGSSAPLFSGERGVICYGERSDQKFTSYDNFKPDYNLIVNSFVIEMRFESKYAPI